MTPTIHNNARLGEIAKTVLMPGDPRRAEFIAENFLENPVLVNDVRCAYCYTGTYEGKPVSVMASGMGIGSAGIYAHELFNDYDVDVIIRVGSAGGLDPTLELGDIVMAMACSTDSSYLDWKGLKGHYSPSCDYGLLKKAETFATEHGMNVRVGNIFSCTAFHVDEKFTREWKDMGMLAMEMEAGTIYTEAALAGKKALAMMTISDMILEDRHMSSKDREVLFGNMIRTALSLV